MPIPNQKLGQVGHQPGIAFSWIWMYFWLHRQLRTLLFSGCE